MTEYLLAARAVMILSTNLAVMPAKIVFDDPNWSGGVSSYKGLCLRPFVARAVWNGIAINRVGTLRFNFGQRKQSWSTK